MNFRDPKSTLPTGDPKPFDKHIEIESIPLASLLGDKPVKQTALKNLAPSK